MRTNSRLRSAMIAGAAALGLFVTAGAAKGDVTVERPGSILILPKVVADGIRDTVVQVTNTSNSLVHAHCYYVDGAPVNPLLPPSPSNPPIWQETDFFIWLTRQQPTHWVVSRGRRPDPSDASGSDGAGIDPGLVPPVITGFTGELICVQVDASAAPTAGNSLKGEATLVGPENDISKYNAIAILGNSVDSNNELLLNNTEYNACPENLQFNHIAEGAEAPVFGPGSSVEGRLTLIPCTQNLQTQVPTSVRVAVQSCDELEFCTSGNPRLVNCWDNFEMSEEPAFQSSASFGPFKYATLTPQPICNGGAFANQPCQPADPNSCGASGTCDGVAGLLGVLETTFRDGGGGSARAAENLHTGKFDTPGAVITLLEP